MLVLSRRTGERIVIGSGIEVVVLSVVGNRVRLGVTAPREIPVHREELARRLPAEAVVAQVCSLSPLPPPESRSPTCPKVAGDISTMGSTS